MFAPGSILLATMAVANGARRRLTGSQAPQTGNGILCGSPLNEGRSLQGKSPRPDSGR
jgi:hypothetical protein